MIVAVDLRRSFGKIEALRGVSLEVHRGEVVGLIGPNGAGKTTTLRILAGVLRPTGGRAEVLGVSITSRDFAKVKRRIAYLPEEVLPYDNLSGVAFIEFIHSLYGVDNVKEAVEISGLGARARDKIKTYSKGMKRRLVLASLLTVGADVLLLDEPTAGVDVIHAVEIRKLVKTYAAEKKAAVLYSSHNMLEVETLCHRVYLISQGEIKAWGSPEELKKAYAAETLEEAFIKAAAVR